MTFDMIEKMKTDTLKAVKVMLGYIRLGQVSLEGYTLNNIQTVFSNNEYFEYDEIELKE